jgi:hypothetical protein
LFLPNSEPEKVIVNLVARRTDPPTVRTLKVGKRDLLATDPDNEDQSKRIWRLSYRNFTVKELHQQLVDEWGIPTAQLEIVCKPTFEAKTEFRLAEGSSIIWPKGS